MTHFQTLLLAQIACLIYSIGFALTKEKGDEFTMKQNFTYMYICTTVINILVAYISSLFGG